MIVNRYGYFRRQLGALADTRAFQLLDTVVGQDDRLRFSSGFVVHIFTELADGGGLRVGVTALIPQSAEIIQWRTGFVDKVESASSTIA